MENLLALIGMLFFTFLVLAASVEVILEVFRGTLECFGVTWAKSKVSLSDALALSKEFAPNNTELNTRMEAVKATAQQLGAKAASQIQAVDALKTQLSAASPHIGQIAAQLNEIANKVKTQLDQDERTRIFIIRTLAAVVGCLLCWQSGFYVFQILADAPESKEWLTSLAKLRAPWINILVGGFAAAAGSSYWHDQLDRIRSLKTATGSFQTLRG